MFLGIYPKELKTYVYTKTCTQVFIAALFTIAKTCKQQRCSWAGEWIRKPVIYLDNGILFRAKKWAIKPWQYMTFLLNEKNQS